ncbi:hypothetical protein JL720_17270 [Aureococcus anophagefferens]|nr:hypothetical protein JL720_17270 [Aureococcus anophagefferens]
MAKTGKQELGIAVSGAWAATLLDRWASLLGGERENNVARLVVGDECLHGAVDHLEEMLPSTPAAVVALADARAPADAVRQQLERFVDYYPSPPPPGVGGETGAFDAGARAMLEGLLKRRFAALPDLPASRASSRADDAGGGGGVAAFYEAPLLRVQGARGRAEAGARTPPLPGSRRSLESVLSRVGFPERYLDKRRAALDAWLRAVVALSAGFDDAGARAAVVDFVDPAGHLHMVLARPTRTNRLRALARFRGAAGAGRGRQRTPGACGGRAGAGAEPAVRWRESAPAFGETAAVVMPEPVDRFDELAAATGGGAARPRGARAGAPPHGRGPLLGVAAALFRAAATDGGGVDGRCCARRPPWGRGSTRFGCGITKMVNVNVAKLEQRFGDAATVDVEVAVADEVARRGGDDSSSSPPCGTRILNLVGRLIDDVLEADDLATDERTISAIATRAYQKTLAKHHNWVLRPAAKALLKMTPDRASLLRDRFGYEADEWNTRARADFADFSGALQACLRRLAAVYAPYDEAI